MKNTAATREFVKQTAAIVTALRGAYLRLPNPVHLPAPHSELTNAEMLSGLVTAADLAGAQPISTADRIAARNAALDLAGVIEAVMIYAALPSEWRLALANHAMQRAQRAVIHLVRALD